MKLKYILSICLIIIIFLFSYIFSKENKTEEKPINDNIQSENNSSSSPLLPGDTRLSEKKYFFKDLMKYDFETLEKLSFGMDARQGKIFGNQKLNSYFKKYEWYKPVSRDIKIRRDEIEKHNFDELQKAIQNKQFFRREKLVSEMLHDKNKSKFPDEFIIIHPVTENISEDDKSDYEFKKDLNNRSFNSAEIIQDRLLDEISVKATNTTKTVFERTKEIKKIFIIRKIIEEFKIIPSCYIGIRYGGDFEEGYRVLYSPVKLSKNRKFSEFLAETLRGRLKQNLGEYFKDNGIKKINPLFDKIPGIVIEIGSKNSDIDIKKINENNNFNTLIENAILSGLHDILKWRKKNTVR